MKITKKIVGFSVLLICIMITRIPYCGVYAGDSSSAEIKVWGEPEIPINPHIMDYPI